MKSITSKDNSIIKEVASLREKKYRDRLGMYIVEGPNLVKEVLEYGGRPRFIFIRVGASQELTEILKLADNTSTVYELTGDVFAKISDTANPQGIIAVADKREYSPEDFFKAVSGGNVLVLDRLQDPGNTGTLLRMCEAMDFKGVILIKGCADPYQPKVVRAAAGAVQRLPMLFAEDADEAAGWLLSHGKRIFGAFMNADTDISDADLRENAAVIIGNEGSGISDEFGKYAERVKIPMSGKTESLNAAIAGTIIMYESKRQKSK